MMSKTEITGEPSPGSSEQLKETQLNDGGGGENTEMKEMDLKIKAELESYYRQSGSKQPKPIEVKPPATQSQE